VARVLAAQGFQGFYLFYLVLGAHDKPPAISCDNVLMVGSQLPCRLLEKSGFSRLVGLESAKAAKV
jgi:hypothetical protein